MSDKIPDDIMETAKAVVGELEADFTYDGQTSGYREEKEACEAIARAVLAERKRCATIAAQHAEEWRVPTPLISKPYASGRLDSAILIEMTILNELPKEEKESK